MEQVPAVGTDEVLAGILLAGVRLAGMDVIVDYYGGTGRWRCDADGSRTVEDLSSTVGSVRVGLGSRRVARQASRRLLVWCVHDTPVTLTFGRGTVVINRQAHA